MAAENHERAAGFGTIKGIRSRLSFNVRWQRMGAMERIQSIDGPSWSIWMLPQAKRAPLKL